jgi:class 3 adenylate cyclase
MTMTKSDAAARRFDTARNQLVSADESKFGSHGPAKDAERILTTVLFTDIVGSTQCVVALGDRKWRELLQSHHEHVRRELVRFRGQEIKTLGDGFLAIFDGPSRAVRCAETIRDSAYDLRLEVRSGLHTGEVEILENDVSGVAVHIAARIVQIARAGEILTSNILKGLVVGSDLRFEDRGTYAFKGLEDKVRIFAAGAPAVRNGTFTDLRSKLLPWRADRKRRSGDELAHRSTNKARMA